jgi:hypothetical protein
MIGPHTYTFRFLRRKNYQRHHVSQQDNFDCGHKCLEMVLRHQCASYSPSMTLPQNSSLWTVELYYELKLHGANCLYYTNYIGVRTELYDLFSWYQLNGNDNGRAQQVFKKCKDCHWEIIQRKISLHFIIKEILKGATAIVLVNGNILNNVLSITNSR